MVDDSLCIDNRCILVLCPGPHLSHCIMYFENVFPLKVYGFEFLGFYVVSICQLSLRGVQSSGECWINKWPFIIVIILP